MNIEPLALSHQMLLTHQFRSLHLMLSEYSFANLYLFRHVHDYHVLFYQNEIFIKGKTRDHVSFIMLTSSPRQLSTQILKTIALHAEILFPVPQSWIAELPLAHLQMEAKEEDSDYLFAPAKFAHFPGRHLHKKRNLVKQLFSAHQITVKPLVDSLDDAQKILENWQKDSATSLPFTDYEACQEALNTFERLHLNGRIIYVDEAPAGFTIGEWLSEECYGVHFAKANRTIKGLYQYLYQDVALQLGQNCSWINIEQDMGFSALRAAKRSYQPDLLLSKWRVVLPSPNGEKRASDHH